MDDKNYTKKIYDLEMKKQRRDAILGIGILVLISPILLLILAVIF